MRLEYEIDGGSGPFEAATGACRAFGALAAFSFRGTWSVTLDEPGEPGPTKARNRLVIAPAVARCECRISGTNKRRGQSNRMVHTNTGATKRNTGNA